MRKWPAKEEKTAQDLERSISRDKGQPRQDNQIGWQREMVDGVK
jgi:hypothetical protein